MDNFIYNRDSLPWLKSQPDQSIDLILTDPPYGVGITSFSLGNGFEVIYRGESSWDDKPLSSEVIQEILRVSKRQIIWGENFIAHLLPPGRCWLVWDKHNGENYYSDCELAWTNLEMRVRKFDKFWLGANARDTRKRLHPCQKPVALMEWCLQLASKPGDLVCDPYMGSGSTGVACHRLERRFIGIERDQGYFDIAAKRLRETQMQPNLISCPE
jgi:DNA modification methylase